MTNEGERPSPNEQTVPSYNGFHASFGERQPLSKTHFHKSYDRSPTKSVLYTNMCETSQAAELKNMPFVVMCGDLPVFMIHVELVGENPEKFGK